MHSPHDPFGGEPVECIVKQSRIVDPDTGEELIAEHRIEQIITPDGVLQRFEGNVGMTLNCGHPLTPDSTAVRCEICSKKYGRSIYVCPEKCAVQDPVTGVKACVRCTTPAPDGNRYSKDGLRKAKRLGLFDRPTDLEYEKKHSRGGFLGWLLSWW